MDEALAEVLRYLGRREQEVPPELLGQIRECMELMQKTAKPRHIRRCFSLAATDDGVLLLGAGLFLRGGDILRHLNNCREAVLMAVTLGAEADTLIRRHEHTDLTHALILDACATRLIEHECDLLEAQIHAEACGIATSRYSPGYGDLALEIQPQILAVLDAGRKIGLTCTDSLILLPRKSVTAIIGLGAGGLSGGCESCNLRESCTSRKDGKQ